MLWSNNGGVQRQQRSALGARRVPHHLSRMLHWLCWDARRSKKTHIHTHNITPCSQASPRGTALLPWIPRRGHYRSPGTRLERLQGAASRVSKAVCSPSLGSNNNGARLRSLAPRGLRPASPRSLPLRRRVLWPPSVTPLPGAAGPRRPAEAQVRAALPRWPRWAAARLRGATLTFPTRCLGALTLAPGPSWRDGLFFFSLIHSSSFRTQYPLPGHPR